VFNAVLSAAKTQGLPVIGHVQYDLGIEGVLSAGQYSIEHLRGYDSDGIPAEELKKTHGLEEKRWRSFAEMTDARMDELINLTITSGAWNCPTLSWVRFLTDEERLGTVKAHSRLSLVHPYTQSAISAKFINQVFPEEVRPAMKESWPRQLEFVRRLNAKGGKLLTGTDTMIPAFVPGFTAIDEIETLVEAGVPIFDALRISTVDAAVSLGQDERLGTLEVGKQASLILIEENPLDDVSALWELSGVMLQGRWFTIADLTRRLESMSMDWNNR
jgi:imidazolonepropionase-like amidohydrolase